MNEPSEEEVNKTIASYMGVELAVPTNLHQMSERQLEMFLPYSRSLDALIPVIEKLDLLFNITFNNWIHHKNNSGWSANFKFKGIEYAPIASSSIQGATALAVYLAIGESERLK